MKQPRVPEYRESEGVKAYIKPLILFLKDFTMAAWTANNQRKKEIEAVKGSIPTMPEINHPVTSVNGKTGDVKLNAEDVGVGHILQQYTLAVQFSTDGWEEQADGSFTQIVSAKDMLESDVAHVDLDMSNVTTAMYADVSAAWGMIGKAQTQNGGLLLTAFDGVPEVDLPVKVEVIR